MLRCNIPLQAVMLQPFRAHDGDCFTSALCAALEGVTRQHREAGPRRWLLGLQTCANLQPLLFSVPALGAAAGFCCVCHIRYSLTSCPLRSQPIASTAQSSPPTPTSATRLSRSSIRAEVAPKGTAARAPDGRRYEPLHVSQGPCLESQTVP